MPDPVFSENPPVIRMKSTFPGPGRLLDAAPSIILSDAGAIIKGALSTLTWGPDDSGNLRVNGDAAAVAAILTAEFNDIELRIRVNGLTFTTTISDLISVINDGVVSGTPRAVDLADEILVDLGEGQQLIKCQFTGLGAVMTGVSYLDGVLAEEGDDFVLILCTADVEHSVTATSKIGDGDTATESDPGAASLITPAAADALLTDAVESIAPASPNQPTSPGAVVATPFDIQIDVTGAAPAGTIRTLYADSVSNPPETEVEGFDIPTDSHSFVGVSVPFWARVKDTFNGKSTYGPTLQVNDPT